MKPSKIYDIMDLALRARKRGDIFNPLFVSAPGLGKTEITQQWAAERKLPAIVMTLSSYDPPDFKGFPNIRIINGRSRMDFATPSTWPDEGEGVIILEELNRAPTSIMQCILSLADKRRGFDGYKLPEGWIIVGCINPEDSAYDVTSMDPALKDRFEMYKVAYDKKEHIEFMESVGYHKDLINFVHGAFWSYKTPEELGNVAGSKYVSNRTFSKVNVLLQNNISREDELMHLETQLGGNIAKDLFNFRHNERPVLLIDLKTHPEASLEKLDRFSNPDESKQGMIEITVKEIIDDASIEDDLLVKVLEHIPVEKAVYLVRELEYKKYNGKVPDGESGKYMKALMEKNPKIKKMFKDVIKYAK